MANKLTDALSALSVKTKSVENKIAAARAEAKEKLAARIVESKAETEAKKAQFIAKAESVKAGVAEKNHAIKTSITQKIDHLKAEAAATTLAVKNKVEEKKQELDVHVAEKKYHDACTYADNCVEWAIVALSEVETATLEAIDAKVKLDDLQKVNA